MTPIIQESAGSPEASMRVGAGIDMPPGHTHTLHVPAAGETASRIADYRELFKFRVTIDGRNYGLGRLLSRLHDVRNQQRAKRTAGYADWHRSCLRRCQRAE